MVGKKEIQGGHTAVPEPRSVRVVCSEEVRGNPVNLCMS
jgi:hypothetical protein